MTDYEVINEKVENKLKPSRFKHTLGVMHFALELAELYQVNQQYAKIAALLHDYCKYETDTFLLEILESHGIPLHPVVRNKPNLAHGQVAAIVVQEEFGLHDEEVLKAISHHTFGAVGMTKLEKIIYLADSLEAGRVYMGVEEFRNLARTDLNQAIIAVSANTMIYELKHGHMIHENTVKMRNALMEEA